MAQAKNREKPKSQKSAPRTPRGVSVNIAAKTGRATTDFLVIGIGASAGGLEALTSLLAHFDPKTCSAALVYVQHLEPHTKSMLTEILGRISPIPVEEAREGGTM